MGKLTFSSHVATAEFSKFAGILISALSQDHLLGFEIAQLEIGEEIRLVHHKPFPSIKNTQVPFHKDGAEGDEGSP